VQSLEAIRAEIDAGGRYHLMQPEAAPEPVGYLATRPDPSARALKLSKLYVERTHRRRGCARRAIEFVERQAKEAGAGAITLTVYPGNVEAIAFYQRLGFTHDGLVRRDFDGFVVDDVAMRKPV